MKARARRARLRRAFQDVYKRQETELRLLFRLGFEYERIRRKAGGVGAARVHDGSGAGPVSYTHLQGVEELKWSLAGHLRPMLDLKN